MPSKPRRIGALLAAGVVLAGTLVATQGGSQAADAPWPGLPNLSPSSAPDLGSDWDGWGTAQTWGGTAQAGITESLKAKQWARVPLSTVAIEYMINTQKADGHGSGGGNDAYVGAWFVSPKNSKGNYGIAQPITVRTVAFGAIPVEASLQVSQRVGDDGLPVPLTTSTMNHKELATNVVTNDAVRVSDAFNVRVVGITVDGVALHLNGDCATTAPAPVALASVPWSYNDTTDSNGNQEFDPAKNEFNGILGGGLTGTIDIPPFAGCTTASGDDISRLATAAISGPGNPLSVSIGAAGCFTNVKGVLVPPAPAEDTPAKAHCLPDDKLNAKGPNIHVVPPEFPYPAR